MGKFKNSNLHAEYSDWHYQLTKIAPHFQQLWCIDIDRLWVEVDERYRDIVAVCDVKYDNGVDRVTTAEAIAYEWFQKQGVPVFVVMCRQVNGQFIKFTVQLYGTEKVWELSPQAYANWLVKLRFAKRKKKGQVEDGQL